MKTVLTYLLIFVILFIVCLIVGFVGCLCKGTLGFRNGSLVGIDANGQAYKPLPWNEGWFNSTNKPTEEEVKQMRAEHQEERSNKAAWLCYAALGSFILGWLTSKAQFHTIGLCFLVGALFWDYKVLATALFLWYFIVPALVLGGIIALFKRS